MRRISWNWFYRWRKPAPPPVVEYEPLDDFPKGPSTTGPVCRSGCKCYGKGCENYWCGTLMLCTECQECNNTVDWSRWGIYWKPSPK